jgi:nucleoside-diphosphate-sugar epimerase
MRVLVTGNRGYIGTVMVPMLLSKGHEVTGLDSGLYEECSFGGAPLEIQEFRKDVRDVSLDDLQGFEAIIHLAGLSNDPLGNLNPELTYEINHVASVRLANLARSAGVGRFLFASSCSIYGAAGDAVLDETASFNPVTPYGRSKMLVEQDVSQLANSKFSPTFLRNATVYGLSPRLRFDLVLNNLVAWAFTTGSVLIKSDGTPWRPIIHVEDVCHAFCVTLTAPSETVHNQAFNVGLTDENYQIRDLANIVKEIVPECNIEYAPDGGPDKRSYQVDFTKISRVFPEFLPKWNAKYGAKQLYEAYRQQGLRLEDFEGPKYNRIDQIRQLLGNHQLDSNLYWKIGSGKRN